MKLVCLRLHRLGERGATLPILGRGRSSQGRLRSSCGSHDLRRGGKRDTLKRERREGGRGGGGRWARLGRSLCAFGRSVAEPPSEASGAKAKAAKAPLQRDFRSKEQGSQALLLMRHMRHKLYQRPLIFPTPARRTSLSLWPSHLAFASPAFEASGFPSPYSVNHRLSPTLILTIRLAAPAVAWNSLCSQPAGLLCPGSRNAGQGPQAASSTPQGCESYSVAPVRKL